MAKMKTPVEGRTRTLVLAAVAIVVVGIMLGLWSWRHAMSDDRVVPPSRVVGAQAPPQPQPGTSAQSSKLYDALIQSRNRQAAKQAEATGQSAMPVIRPGVEKDPIVQRDAHPAPTAPAPAPSVDREDYRKALEARRKAIASRQDSMAQQLALLQKTWTIEGHTQLVAATPKDANPAPGASGAKSPVASGAKPVQAPLLAHAGQTAVAVLDTPINTDNPLPMYKATIVQAGPLHGATLLGTIDAGTQRYGAGVNLTFTTITIPGHGTVPVSAFAINASDAGALTGEVNRHLWQRYAAAFGGAFLQGVGQGLLAGGRQQQVITSANGYAVQSSAYTNKQLMMMGAANVGQVAASSMQSILNRPPTIKIPGQTTIGVFFTADLQDQP